MLGELFVELVIHLAEDQLHIEVPLDPIYQVHFVKVSLLVEPAMRHVALDDGWQSELPYFEMVRDEVKHGAEVLLSPEMSQLLFYQAVVVADL